jgi:hypothetical protein
MPDKNCPNYFSKDLLGKITEECCESDSRYQFLDDHSKVVMIPLCDCGNYETCSWYLKDNKLEKD